MAVDDLKIAYRDPAKLEGYDRNARQHSDEQLDEIAASIERFGFINPIALKDDGVTIGAGHGRQGAALRLGLKRVPTITLKGLSEAEWRAYVLADNRLAEKATWDWTMLTAELADIRSIDATLAGVVGWSTDEIDTLMHLQRVPSLDDLSEEFGAGDGTDFWPVLKIKVSPVVKETLDRLFSKVIGATDGDKLAAILSTVDEERL